MDAQAIVWFVIAAVAAITGARMLFDRYVRQKPGAAIARRNHAFRHLSVHLRDRRVRGRPHLRHLID
ncbi:MAG: hypothetical protein R2843_01650 [Thermomicrobiales bacterium]